MKKRIAQILGILLALMITVSIVPAESEAATYISVSDFADMVEDALGGNVMITDENVPESDMNITRGQALYLINKAHEMKYGTDFEPRRYDNIITKGLTRCLADPKEVFLYHEGEVLVPRAYLEERGDTSKSYDYLNTFEKKATYSQMMKEKGYTGNFNFICVSDLTEEEKEALLEKQYYDTQYEQIVEKGRISDLGKIDQKLHDDVIKAYMRGYMKGKSDGKCSPSRSLKAHKLIKAAAAEKLVQKFITQKGLAILSPDGQLVRTKKLPKNVSRYEYILANFPNSFYERKAWYDLETRDSFSGELIVEEEGVDYYYPVNLKQTKQWWGNLYYAEKYGDVAKIYVRDILDDKKQLWCDKVETNLRCRLNFNYKTVDEKKWVQTLVSTYMDDYSDTMYDYIKEAKKNKVVVECSELVVEPSTMYEYDGNYYIRAYVRFRVKSESFNGEEGKPQAKLVYGHWGSHSLKGLKNNVWHEGYYDIKLGTRNTAEVGDTLGVLEDWLDDWLD